MVIFRVTTHIQDISRLEYLLAGMNKIGFKGTYVPIHMHSNSQCKLERFKARKMGFKCP
jgi:hypothetical protein